MLLVFKSVQTDLRLFIQTFDQKLVLCFFFLFLDVYCHKSVKFQLGSRYGKVILPSLDLHGGGLILGRLHAACGKPLPDQLIQPVLVSAERLLDGQRRPGNIGRADGFMGILDIFLFISGGFCRGCVLCAVLPGNVLSGCRVCFL